MKPVQITVDRSELLAALLFASADDSRYTLNSVCLQVGQRQVPLVVATDGRRLAVIKTIADQAEGESFDAFHELILPRPFVRAICSLSRALGGPLHPWLRFHHARGSARIDLIFVGVESRLVVELGGLIDGKFPDWQAAMPPKSKATRVPIADMGINAAYVGDFAKAAKLLGAPGSAVQMNLVGKDSAVEVRIAGLENFYGLVMQCKCDDQVEYQPEFVSIVKDLPVAEPEADDSQEEAP